MDGVAFVRKNVRLPGFIIYVNVRRTVLGDQRRAASGATRADRLVGRWRIRVPQNERRSACVRAYVRSFFPPGTCTERNTGGSSSVPSMPVDARDGYDGSIAPHSRVKNKTSEVCRAASGGSTLRGNHGKGHAVKA